MVLFGKPDETERKIIEILRVLNESSEPVGSNTIARELVRHGVIIGERGVRYHLKITDERGYTQSMGRQGRMITTRGIDEIKMALAPEEVGSSHNRLELLAFLTTFDPKKGTGQVPINTSLIDEIDFDAALSSMKSVFKTSFCMSNLIAIAREGEKLGAVVIPRGKVGIGTLCNVAITGILLKAGVPIEYRFGGLLEVSDFKPKRFVSIINYLGTSLDPSEQFIRARMTSVAEAIRTGHGNILAVFRSIPAPARDIVEELNTELSKLGIAGIITLGCVSESVCHIMVGLNRIGMILPDGLNPIAAVAEAGIEINSMAASGLIEFKQLQPVSQF